MTIRYPGSSAFVSGGTDSGFIIYGGRSFDVPGTGAILALPLPRPTALYGQSLGVKAVRVCYASQANLTITGTVVVANERGIADSVNVIDDPTGRPSNTQGTCYNVSVTPQARAGQNSLLLPINNSANVVRSFTLHSVALTLAPLPAGAAALP